MRESLAWSPENLRAHSGAFGPIPDRCEHHPDGCPGIQVRPGLEARVYPTLLVTPAIREVVALHAACARLHVPPVAGPLLSWPARIVDLWLLLDAETDAQARDDAERLAHGRSDPRH